MSRDGQRVAFLRRPAQSAQIVVRIIETGRATTLQHPKLPPQLEIYDLVFTPDGSRLISGALDGTCIVRDLEAPRVV